MKLNVTFEHDANGRERAVVTDDRGERMPGVQAFTVERVMGGPDTVTVRLTVDRHNVTLGARAADAVASLIVDWMNEEVANGARLRAS